ncbi:MAG TPA: site-2 protease family protein [Pirellulales bacterium]
MNPEPGRPESQPAIASSLPADPHNPLAPANLPAHSGSSETYFPPVPVRDLDESDLGPPQRRRVVPLVLFLLTCFFTYAAGAYHWKIVWFATNPQTGDPWSVAQTWKQLTANWQDGLVYMLCVMSVLLAHEMGHFLMTVRYKVPASYPIFLPMPLMFTGTMGAVIGMEGFRANRRQMFDIGLAGPLAGLVLTIPMVWIGIKMAQPIAHQPDDLIFGDPMLAKMLMHWLRPDMPANSVFKNPVYMAGWVGMFVTGLNMMPVSQLDGGHVIYALFLKRGHYIARAFLLAAMTFVIVSGQVSWTAMLVIITLLGVDHPPTSDDRIPLGFTRTVLGLLSLVLPVLCFTPFRLHTG